MILDGHIHINKIGADGAAFAGRLKKAGVAGGIVLSLPPPAFPAVAPSAKPLARLDDLLRLCASAENLHPFYWIDPLEADAAEQAALAAEKGAAGFKVICDRFFPGDRRALKVFRAIASAGKPILFHSGILWDGKPSSRYNRPAEFEALMDVKGLRFALAHIGWPWCDELIAVYGKLLTAKTRAPGGGGEMFVDITPGTPPIYRRDALTKLFGAGYDVGDHVIFGTDGSANAYDAAWTRQWVARDRAIYARLGLGRKTVAAVFGGNLQRFLGLAADGNSNNAARP